MPANQTRGRPGLFLLIFAFALLLTAAGSWELRRAARGLTTAVALTGVGDTRYYTMLSENDFNRPALVFSHAPQGLFRRTADPVHREDSRMLPVEAESTGRHTVYTDAGHEPGASAARRWYLKAGTNLYVEFGGVNDGSPRPPPKS